MSRPIWRFVWERIPNYPVRYSRVDNAATSRACWVSAPVVAFWPVPGPTGGNE